jgi:hypothetical protein
MLQRAGRQVVADQRRYFDVVDQSELQGRIEIAHRADVEVDDAAGPQSSDIVDLDDDAFVGALNQRIGRLIAFFPITELVAQIGADRRAPVFGVVFSPDAVLEVPELRSLGSPGLYVDAIPSIGSLAGMKRDVKGSSSTEGGACKPSVPRTFTTRESCE